MLEENIEGISRRPVAECTAAEVADALTRSFEGYVMPVNVDAQGYEHRFRPENVDPFASYVYFRESRPVALILIARRGWTSRVAAMAVVPEVRGSGVGKRIIQRAVREAIARGDRSMLLEVFEHNTPAVNLYKGQDFKPVRRLVGYHHEPGGAPPDAADKLSGLDPLDFARVVAREGESALPWMLAAETLSGAVSPARSFHLDHRAYALIGDPAADVLSLTALVVPRGYRRNGWGTRLMLALFTMFQDHAWFISQIVPEELAPEFFARCGWESQDTNQLEMVLDLSQT
ncbi:MAG: GNAT family N-acetyltransferase [Rubrobacteraceae bacterium]|nr:GNAT family N-acetyltransferase [Rubrobacteraceae bacterium]